MYPTAEDRKQNPYTRFRKNLRRVTLDYDDTNTRYELEGSEPYSEMYKASHPELPDPTQLFKQTIFNAVYNQFKGEVVQEDEQGNRSYDIEPMKLAEIYNKAVNRSYELLITAVVCNRMFNQTLHNIPSRAAHQKQLWKKIKKSNRE